MSMVRNIFRLLAPTVIAMSITFAAPSHVMANSAPETEKIAAWLKAAVADRLIESLSGSGKIVEQVEVPIPANFKAPADFDGVDITLPYKERLTNKVFVTVTFKKDGNPISRLNLLAKTKVMGEVVVTTRRLSRGSIVGAADIERRTIQLGPAYVGASSDTTEVIGKTLQRDLRKGTPIRSSFLLTPKLVNSGDMVIVVATAGGLRITTQALAKQDGDRGQWIRVMNTRSNKIFNAQVVGQGRVKVEF